MHTLKQAVDDLFVMDYDNIPGKGPLMLFRKLDDGTMTLATPAHIVEFVESHTAAFRKAVEELRDAQNQAEVFAAHKRLIDLLPKDPSDA